MPKIPLSRPDITDQDCKAVLDVLRTDTLSLGDKYKEFEALCAKVAGVKYAVATNSGTSALHLIVRAMGIGEGDEVITTPFSFVASANCLLYEKATPVFVDIDPKTFCIDASQIEAKITNKTKAILAVDVFGRPANWDALKAIAKKHKLLLIEDAAEAVGAVYNGKPCGSLGDAAVFSFYPNKQMTTGEGGMVLTNDKRIYEVCQSMSNQGRKVRGGAWLEHVRLGYNYRMDEMSAALGVSQIKRLQSTLKKRASVAQAYRKSLSDIAGVQVMEQQPGTTMSWFVYVVLLNEQYAGTKRDKVLELLRKQGVACRDYFKPIHQQPLYRDLFGGQAAGFPVTDDISSRTVALPFHNALSVQDVMVVARALENALEKVS